jgi:hypothetical protein
MSSSVALPPPNGQNHEEPPPEELAVATGMAFIALSEPQAASTIAQAAKTIFRIRTSYELRPIYTSARSHLAGQGPATVIVVLQAAMQLPGTARACHHSPL